MNGVSQVGEPARQVVCADLATMNRRPDRVRRQPQDFQLEGESILEWQSRIKNESATCARRSESVVSIVAAPISGPDCGFAGAILPTPASGSLESGRCCSPASTSCLRSEGKPVHWCA